MDSKDIIERDPFHNDTMMYKKCLLLQDICTQSKEEKLGRGKKATTITIPLYDIDKEVLDKINRSVEFYKELMNKKKTTIKLRPYQESISTQAAKMITVDGFVYLAMEVRTGKTFTSLSVAQKLNCKHVLFVTKKKAISSIESDYNLLMPSYEMEVINYESIHKVESLERFDLIVLDEAHSMGAFPKPSNRAKQVKEIIKKYNPYVILLSGTPTPESYSQFYHQVYGIKKNPFTSFKNFYRFCDTYVDVTERKINGLMIKDYSKGRDSITEAMKPHTISYSQKEAGFKVDTREHTLYVPMSKLTYRLTSQLKNKLVIEGKDEVILADTPVKLMMKLHQM